MRTKVIGDNARDLINAFLAVIKRYSTIYLNGGQEDDWGFAVVSKDVIDINTKMPIRGPVMRKVMDGKWVFRQMTEAEREDFDAGRRW